MSASQFRTVQGSCRQAACTTLAVLLGVLAMPLAVTANGAATDLYWTSLTNIYTAKADGTNIQVLVPASQAGAIDLALDEDNGKLYWVSGTDTLRADLDGTNIELLNSGVFFGGISNRIGLDLVNGQIFVGAFGRIWRFDLDGSNTQLVYQEAGIANITGPAVDAANGKLYWAITQPGLEKIVRSDLDGNNLEDLVTSGVAQTNGLTLDLADGKMYWTGDGMVRRANLDGSAVEVLVDWTNDPKGPADVALDISDNTMYILEGQFASIFTANLDGSSLASLFFGTGSNPLSLVLTTEAGIPDADGDGVPDDQDICAGGDDNIDSDFDGVPDFCDPCPFDADNDADGDGICGDVDVCAGGDDTVNTDGDSLPDFCDVCPLDFENDADGDGVCESEDNCPSIANPGQPDNDQDGAGDQCDSDDDNDGFADGDDNCPLTANDQTDTDGDGAGDECDADSDGDGVTDDVDACLLSPVGDPVNTDGCAIADLCPCEHPVGGNKWKNHGGYVRCVAHTSEDFVDATLITESEKDAIVSEAGQSSCGHRN